MRTIQELQKLTEAQTVNKAAQEIVDKIGLRMAARSLGTMANRPLVVNSYPAYNEDGNEIRYMQYGDLYGEYPLKP